MLKEDAPQIGTSLIQAATFQIAYFHLAFGDPGKALHWANKLDHSLRESRTRQQATLRRDLRWVTTMLKLMIAIDEGDIFLQDHFYRSAYRFLGSLNLREGFVRQFLLILQRIINLPIFERWDSLDTEVKKLEAMLLAPLERRYSLYFDAIGWLKANKAGKTIGEINRLAFGGKKPVKAEPINLT